MALLALAIPAALALLPLTASSSSPPPPFSLSMDRDTGAWNGASIGGKPVTVTPGQEAGIYADGADLPPASEWHLESIRKRGSVTTVARRAGAWDVVLRYELRGAELRKSVTFQWLGAGRVTVRGAWLSTPVLRLSDDPTDVYEVPGNFPVTRRAFSVLRPGVVSAETGWTRGDYGAALLVSGAAQRYLAASYAFVEDQARVSVREAAGGVAVRHSFDTALWVQPGQSVTVGYQVLRVGVGARGEALAGLATLCGSVGNGPPADRPASLDRNVILEAHPWGRLEVWPTGDRGNRYDRLTALTPYWHDLGATCVWLLPVSWPPPWVYTLPQFDRVAPENGSQDELKGFLRAAHTRKMRALIDLVVYGILPSSPEVLRLPEEVWAVGEDGKRQMVWGGAVLAADCGNPAWMAKMHDVAHHWARDFGFDGARLDCVGWGQTANWARLGRANAAVAAGGIKLNGVLRSAFREGNPGAFLLPEGGKPLVFKNADMVFDYPFYLALRDGTLRHDRARWIADLREWLQYERLCYPARARQGLVRFLELHDTVSAAEYFGVGPSQALMALCTFIEGTPLIQQEQETGFTADLRRWLQLRGAVACLRSGDADYLGVRCANPSVIAFTRSDRSEAAVVAVNLSKRDVTCDLAWPASLGRRFAVVCDALTGRRVHAQGCRARVTIPAYRPVVLLLRAGAMVPKAFVRRPEPAPMGAWREASDGVEVEDCAGWRIETAEGRLEDRFFDQHVRVKPGEAATLLLPVLGRAWNPLAGGLLDGALQAAIVLTQRDGRQVRVELDSARLTDARIVDGRADGKSVKVVLAPREAWRIEGTKSISPAAAVDEVPNVEVDPWFVTIRTDRGALVLARRHGGMPIAWETRSGVSALAPGGDFYTDFGLVPNRTYASCDGETNPRLSIHRDGDAVTVTFHGMMRERAWNGVQTCSVAPPSLAYRLTYVVTPAGQITVQLGITASAGVAPVPAFLALRIPLAGFQGCRVGGAPVKASDATQRIAVTGDNREALLRTGSLHWSDGSGLARSFVIDGGDGQATLFLAVLDGDAPGLTAGVERIGTATLELGGAEVNR